MTYTNTFNRVGRRHGAGHDDALSPMCARHLARHAHRGARGDAVVHQQGNDAL